jgi:hypothetical protein
VGIDTAQYIRKPLYVQAVRVSKANFDEIVGWCQGEILTDEPQEGGAPKQYVKVRVHNPKNARQTKAFVGDWILYTERGYKVYTNKAFHASFDLVVVGGENETVRPEVVSAAPALPKIAEFYLDPESGELTEEQPHSGVKPLNLVELMNIVRNELVGAELNTEVGGELNTEPQASVEAKNQNHSGMSSEEYAEGAVEVASEIEAPPVNEQVRHAFEQAEHIGEQTVYRDAVTGEFVDKEYAEANPDTTVRETVKDEYVPATPENIAQAVQETEAARNGNAADAEIQRRQEMGEPKPENAEKVAPSAVEGKRVLSQEEQQELGTEQVRELLKAGEVVLAQDVATP